MKPAMNPLSSSVAQVSEARSYRCSYHPKDLNGHPIASDSGILPTVQVKAANAEHAQRAAQTVTGCAVCAVERIESEMA